MKRVFACVCVLAACGGGGETIEGEPLIATNLSAMFDNRPWMPVYGFARMNGANFEIFVGDKKISCADKFTGEPRDGHYASLGFAGAPVVGNMSNVLYDLIEVVNGNLTGKGAQGTLMITTVNDADLSAVMGFSTTIDGGAYALTGAVTLFRCP